MPWFIQLIMAIFMGMYTSSSYSDKDGKVLYKEYIAIRCKDGDVGFYTPTQCDILAEDWKVIVE